jgi:hypothetical protein
MIDAPDNDREETDDDDESSGPGKAPLRGYLLLMFGLFVFRVLQFAGVVRG